MTVFSPRIALVHDYLNQRGGAERVFAHIARAYPQAPIFTALFNVQATGDLVDARRVHTSFIQRIPFANRFFRFFAPLYPSAFERFDLQPYDLVITSTTAWAKGVITRKDATHVCYINTVSRFVFAYDTYVGGFGFAALARPIIRALVRWDREAAQRPTAFIANSQNVAARIRTFYGRDAYVLPCPVDVSRYTVQAGTPRYYLVVSRFLPYKKIDRAIAACALAGVALKIVGSGPAERELRQAARETDTEFLGPLSDTELNDAMRDAYAIILPGEEDFGLVPIEANAAGRPAIAFGRGGALETIVAGVTGEHFPEPSAESLAAVLRAFTPSRYDPVALREYAESFAPQRFIERFQAIVAEILAARDAA